MSKPNRIVCPYCSKNVPGIEIIGGTVAINYNRDILTFDRGTIPCNCGARLVVMLGVVVESVPPRELPGDEPGSGGA